jgi:hypothetical protein
MTGRVKPKAGAKTFKTEVVIQKGEGIEAETHYRDHIKELVKNGGGATVSASVGYSYQPYAPGKASVTVTIGCDQDSKIINRAGLMAIEKAKQYALDAMEMIRDDVESGRFNIEE